MHRRRVIPAALVMAILLANCVNALAGDSRRVPGARDGDDVVTVGVAATPQFLVRAKSGDESAGGKSSP